MEQPVFVPSVSYKDPLAALRWLRDVFGFEVTSLVTDADGKLQHSEMGFHGGAISVAGEWEGPPFAPSRLASPLTTGGVGTQFLRVHLPGGLDAHCEAARKAGARILAEPEDQFYGARVYRAIDPEGHVWTFSQEVREVSTDEMERATGLRIRNSLAEA